MSLAKFIDITRVHANFPYKSSKQKLDPEDIPLIRALLEDGMPVKEVAEKFEVSKFSIYRIRRGDTWKHI
jgi:DNA invertase Pin-like site-specific DNA recombinase